MDVMKLTQVLMPLVILGIIILVVVTNNKKKRKTCLTCGKVFTKGGRTLSGGPLTRILYYCSEEWVMFQTAW